MRPKSACGHHGGDRTTTPCQVKAKRATTGSLKAAHPISRTCGAQGASQVSEEAFEQGASRFRGTYRQAEAGLRHVRRDYTQLDSSPETSASCAFRAVRISPEAPRLLISSFTFDAGTVNQRPFGARGLAMRGETIREHARERRPDTRPRQSAGPPRETCAHATPCRKTAYARRTTRTPRSCGQGVHSEPAAAPVSRAPLEVGRAKRASNRRVGFRFPERARYPSGALEPGFLPDCSKKSRRQAHSAASGTANMPSPKPTASSPS